MPINPIYKAPFECGGFYHVFNRSVDGQKLFYDKGNYHFFLEKYYKYLWEVVRLHAWSLIPNHFHFYISVRDVAEMSLELPEAMTVDGLVTSRFKNFFISYSQSLKKQRGVRTNVFSQKFRHKRLVSNLQMTNLFYYIHHNALHHGLTMDWEGYPWSSYGQIAGGRDGLVDVPFALNWFGGREKFVRDHRLNAGKYFSEYDLQEFRTLKSSEL